MEQYISKSALIEEIERRKQVAFGWMETAPNDAIETEFELCDDILSFINTLEVKEVEEYKQPEYSCLETVYKCGKKSRWNLGDTLAYYEFYSDREGECVLGKVTKVEFYEEQCDWFYTFEDGSVYDEQSLLEEQTYKKN